MNRSKLTEWLLDNDCPWDFDVADDFSVCDYTTLVFTDKEEEEQ